MSDYEKWAEYERDRERDVAAVAGMNAPVYEAQKLIPRAGACGGIGTWSVVRSRDNLVVLESPSWDQATADNIALRLNAVHAEAFAEEAARKLAYKALRHLYIGAVSLLCRVHGRLDGFERKVLADDGNPMERLADSFNTLDFHLIMQPSGDRWTLSDGQLPSKGDL